MMKGESGESEEVFVVMKVISVELSAVQVVYKS